MKAELVYLPKNDLGPVNAARVSFDKESVMVDGKLDVKDVKLINYLASHEHWTPFSHNRITFWSLKRTPIFDPSTLTPELSTGLVHKHNASYARHSLYGWVQMLKQRIVSDVRFRTYIINALYTIYPESMEAYGFRKLVPVDSVPDIIFVSGKMESDPDFIDFTMRETVPIFVARQRFKHMVGFAYNEVSRRYVDDDPEFFIPDVWRARPDKSIKQGSSEEPANMIIEMRDSPMSQPYTINLAEWYELFIQEAEQLYKLMTDEDKGNVAPEMARMVLPQSMFTSYYVTGSLTAWNRALKQRIDGHAQKEIRILAKQWKENLEKAIENE